MSEMNFNEHKVYVSDEALVELTKALEQKEYEGKVVRLAISGVG